MLLGRRKFSLLDLDYDSLTAFVKEVDAFSERIHELGSCRIAVTKDVVVCCGMFPIGVMIDFECASESNMKQLDTMMYSKVMQICESEDITFHESAPLEILK
jgi:hypothetical protein